VRIPVGVGMIAGPGNSSPSPNGNGNGHSRGNHGRFGKGNPGGPGNPLGSKIEKLRAALVNAVTEEDIAKMAKGLIKSANRGSPAAASVVWDRIFGKAKQPIEMSGKNGKRLTIRVVYEDRGVRDRERMSD
jgi:hypothetical protein